MVVVVGGWCLGSGNLITSCHISPTSSHYISPHLATPQAALLRAMDDEELRALAARAGFVTEVRANPDPNPNPRPSPSPNPSPNPSPDPTTNPDPSRSPNPNSNPNPNPHPYPYSATPTPNQAATRDELLVRAADARAVLLPQPSGRALG